MKVRRQRYIPVSWRALLTGWYKFNTDGASKGNLELASGGKVIKDESGSFIAGFSNFYGHDSNLYVEARALLDRISFSADLH
ncbi:hypothetical protein ACH5RR_021218 [Cinchona calisaya]|uniref:RNase H type-1 domain-containing protein n=1 Tax=Cinchona calisaya TaxID=153742 RepID=A0ABD2ZHQ3_9GENT